MPKSKTDKRYFATVYGEPRCFFDTIEEVLNDIRADSYDDDDIADPRKIKFFVAYEGTYVPPSTPETVVFQQGE